MKKFTMIIAGLGIATAALPATAQAASWDQGHQRYAAVERRGDDRGWVSIHQRKMQIERRIEQGIRSGALTRGEARSLTAQFHNLERLEARYRASGHGLTRAERVDLDRRYDALAARVRYEKHDRQESRYRR